MKGKIWYKQRCMHGLHSVGSRQVGSLMLSPLSLILTKESTRLDNHVFPPDLDGFLARFVFKMHAF